MQKHDHLNIHRFWESQFGHRVAAEAGGFWAVFLANFSLPLQQWNRFKTFAINNRDATSIITSVIRTTHRTQLTDHLIPLHMNTFEIGQGICIE